MKPITSSLFHRVLPPATSSASRHPTIIYLHGLGADEEDLLGLSGHLDERFMSISVRAPYPYEFGGYAWYEILEMGKPEHTMFKTSFEKLTQFVHDALAHYPIDPERLFLLGFSMGTVMSYTLTLTQPQTFAGVVANSGYLAEETYLDYKWKDVAGRDIIITHGLHDPIIPVQAAQRARLLLENAHARVTYKEYEMAHQIGNESLADVNAWLNQRLATTAPTA
jgi:phospholipase/carboxylesterase